MTAARLRHPDIPAHVRCTKERHGGHEQWIVEVCFRQHVHRSLIGTGSINPNGDENECRR